MFKPSSEFTNRSKVVHFCYLCVTFVFLSMLCVCSLQPCDHLLGKDCLLGFLVCDVSLFFYHFPKRSLRSSVVLDCINSWFLPSSLLLIDYMNMIVVLYLSFETKRLLKPRFWAAKPQYVAIYTRRCYDCHFITLQNM